MMPKSDDIATLGKYFAIESNNKFWKLSEKELNDNERESILKFAFASLYHWETVGNDDNKYLAYLAVSRAFAINNVSELAVRYAQEAYDFFENTEQAWISAFTNAVLSHALFVSGDTAAAKTYYHAAYSIGSKLNEGDKAVFWSTFQLIPEPV